MLLHWCLLVITLAADPGSAEPSVVVINTSSGRLQGRLQKTPRGLVRQLLGVRYGLPPIGELRFKPPQPYRASANASILSADQFAPACVQQPHRTEYMYSQLARGQAQRKHSEDCLFLNVFTPVKPALRAILVFLPGEGFSFADPAQWDASWLAARGDIIVVTVAYRVGVHGFLSTGSKIAPGNAGLWDVLAALQWVQHNAVALGGDAKRVTLLGRFSGAMAASLLMTSPLMKQEPLLARRFVLQSGVATSGYVLDDKPHNRTFTLAKLAHCPLHDENVIISCLRDLSVAELERLSWQVPELWRPVVDGKLVVQAPWHAAHLGSVRRDVDVMVGETSGEGALCLLQHFFLETNMAPRILADELSRADFAELVKEHVRDHTKVANPVLEKIVAHEYRYALPAPASYRARYLHFCGVLYSRVAAERFTRELARHGTRVYRYEFDHRPAVSHQPTFMGAVHGDDALFVFSLLDVESNQSLPGELHLQDQVVAAWSNFVKTGNPNVESTSFNIKWPLFSSTLHEMLVIRAENASLVLPTTFMDRDIEFWDSVSPAVLYATRPRECPVSPPRHVGGSGVAMLVLIVMGVALLLGVVALLLCARGVNTTISTCAAARSIL